MVTERQQFSPAEAARAVGRRQKSRKSPRTRCRDCGQLFTSPDITTVSREHALNDWDTCPACIPIRKLARAKHLAWVKSNRKHLSGPASRLFDAFDRWVRSGGFPDFEEFARSTFTPIEELASDFRRALA